MKLLLGTFNTVCFSSLLLLSVSVTGFHETSPPRLTNIYFADSQHGWALGVMNGNSKVYKTVDGGENWTEKHQTKESLLRIKFADSANGWIVGSNGTILHTSDGGSTWRSQENGSKAVLYGVAVLGSNTAWVAGASGTLFLTTNAGATWTRKAIDTQAAISDIAFCNSRDGILITYGKIFSTTDGGVSWVKMDVDEWKHLSSVVCSGENKRWVLAGSAILQVGKSGAVDNKIVIPSRGKITRLSLLNEQYGWVITSRGENGDVAHINDKEKLSSESFVLSTNDNGKSWHEIIHLKSDKDHSAWLTDICFINSLEGWAVGWDGLVLKTVDGGKSWQRTQIKV